jgi:Ca2+/H+ antiporter
VHHLDRFLFSLPSTERFAGAVVLKISAKREATSAVRAA